MRKYIVIVLLLGLFGIPIRGNCADGVSMLLKSNASLVDWDNAGKGDETIQIEVFLINNTDHEVRLLSAPNRILNLNSFKVMYRCAVSGVDGKVVVPNPYELRPVCVPPGTALKIERISISKTAVPSEILRKRHITFEGFYEIDPEVKKFLAVWTGNISAEITLK